MALSHKKPRGWSGRFSTRLCICDNPDNISRDSHCRGNSFHGNHGYTGTSRRKTDCRCKNQKMPEPFLRAHLEGKAGHFLIPITPILFLPWPWLFSPTQRQTPLSSRWNQALFFCSKQFGTLRPSASLAA